VKHSPEAPSASSGSEQSAHSWPAGSIAFEVRLIGVRRNVRRGSPPTTPDIEIMGADRIHEALMAADAASAPLAHHPKVIATAHNAALTTSYFRRAARALGEALAAWLDGRPPPNALNTPVQPRQRVRTQAAIPLANWLGTLHDATSRSPGD
jgi:hypothetical protein